MTVRTDHKAIEKIFQPTSSHGDPVKKTLQWRLSSIIEHSGIKEPNNFLIFINTIIDHFPARSAGEKRKGFNMAKTLGDITSELTENVLAPAKAEAENLLKAARDDAGKIVAAAETEAQRVRETATREVENLRKQMNVDLDTAARNFLIMVEERLEKAVVDPVIEENLKPLLGDREFLAKMVEDLLAGFSRLGSHEHRIELLLPEAKRAELETWFLQKFHEKVSQPLDIRFTDKISFGFKIGIAGSGNHINFSDGLIQVFSEFCSPRFRKHFFSRKES